MQDQAQKATTTSAEERSQEFVAVTGGSDTTSAETMLVLAYLLMWLMIFGFVFLTRRKQARLDERLDGLEQALRRADNSGESG
jgi:CcmD family protein